MWVVLVAGAVLAGGCANPGHEEAPSSVFVFDRDDLETVVSDCRGEPTVDCRNQMIYVARAHIDAARLGQSQDRNLLGKTFGLLVLAASTAATRVSGETAKTNIALGLALVAGVRQIFDVGEEDAGLHSSDVWEKIVARTNLPLETYPLEAALADLEEYRVLKDGE